LVIGVDVDQKKEGTFIKDQNSFWAMSDDDLIEFLKEDLKKSRWDKAIIEGVPEEKVAMLEEWIEENKGKIEGIEVSIIPTLTGLTVEEEELIENEYSSMLAVDRTKLIKNKIERIQINLATQYIAGSEPQREDAQLRWWEQMLQKAQEQNMANKYRLIREKKSQKISTKTAKKYKKSLKKLKGIEKKLTVVQPLLEKHSHIGKGSRRHELLLDEQIDLFDQGLTERNEGVQQPSGKVLIRFKQYLKEKKEELKTKIDIEEIEDEYDCLKWRYPDGRTGKQIRWSGFPQRLKRIRDRRKK
jgi:hypothetical protein